MKICGTKIDDEMLGKLQSLAKGSDGLSRTSLARRACGVFGWRDGRGELREVSCRIGLSRLSAQGLLDLPAARPGPPPRSSARRQAAAPDIGSAAFSGSLAELGDVELVQVSSRKLSMIWNQMMDAHHYLGSGPLCGAQLRYLFRSPGHGWLGGLSWSASALRVDCRDQWIGWSDWARERNLEQVVCNSRFLVLPGVRVGNLASHVLSLCTRRLPGDWRRRYGKSPLLLETFVDASRFRGSCYRAANWAEVGQTKGRGRQDRRHECKSGAKRYFALELCADARRRLCRSAVPPPARQYADWAEEEFGAADFGDERLKRRLHGLALAFFNRPQASLPQACGDRAAVKAAYRFFDKSQVGMDSILASHYQATEERVGREKIVLAVQDTTSINYTGLRDSEGLGPIGSRPAANGAIGLMLHDTMAFTAEGTPLGLVAVQCWARPDKPARKIPGSQLRNLPISEKESNKWLESYRAASELQRRCPETLVVSVGDREADVYELFDLAKNTPGGAKLLVRGKWNRRLADSEGQSLMTAMETCHPAGIMNVNVPRRKGRPERTAEMEVRFRRVTLRPPSWRKECRAQSVWAVLVRETRPPPGTEALEWLLLTTLPVDSLEEAVGVVGFYARRWSIEIYHKTLKSGCRIEERQLGSADRLETCLAIDMVVAWRIYHLAWLGRETPDVPCTVFFQEAEWKALWVKVNRNPDLPEKPPTLRDATRMVASLGGFLGRKCDGEPGNKALWLGIQRLDDITDMFVFMTSMFAGRDSPFPIQSGPDRKEQP